VTPFWHAKQLAVLALQHTLPVVVGFFEHPGVNQLSFWAQYKGTVVLARQAKQVAVLALQHTLPGGGLFLQSSCVS